MTTRSLAWASLRLHGRRYVATAAAIIIGVGFCAGTLAVTAATKKGLGDALVVQYSKADVIVRPLRNELPSTKLQDIGSLPSVASATMWGSGGASITWKNFTEQTYVGVAEIAGSADLRWQELQSGVFPTEAGQVAVDADFAADEGIDLGDTVPFAVQGNSQSVQVVGLTDPVKGAYVPQVFIADGIFDGWVDVSGTNELLLTANEGTSASELAEQVRDVDLDAGVATAEQERTRATSHMTGDVDIVGMMLQAFVAIALIVMGLVIANTFSIVLAQRSRELALMRCVGAERRQVLAMVVMESLALGVVAAVLGTAVGLGLAVGLVTVVNQTALPVPMSLGVPSLSLMLIPAAVGIAVTLVASLGPARRATRVPPLSALRSAEPALAARSASLLRVAFGLLVLTAGAAVMFAAMGRASLLLGLAGGAVSFLGVLALTPVVVPAMVRLASGLRRLLPRRLRGGVPVELSIANSLRNPRRTAATASALLIGVTLISMLAVGASSMSASAATAIDHNNPIDVTIVGAGTLPKGLAERVGAIESVSRVVAISGTTIRSHRADVTVAAVDADDAEPVVRDQALVRDIEAGRVVVPPEYRWLVNYRHQPSITLRGANGPVDLRVGGMTGADMGAIVVSPQTLSSLGGGISPVALWLAVDDDADPRALLSDLDNAVTASGGGLDVSSAYVARSSLDRALDIMLVVASALLGMAVLIALVGVGNTLSLSVVERSVEHAVLRALGLTKVQQRLMLASEAALMALAAALRGVALGIGFGWAGTVTAIGRVTEQDAVLDVPWLRLAVIVGVAVLAGLAASVIPSRRATRISPAAALAEG